MSTTTSGFTEQLPLDYYTDKKPYSRPADKVEDGRFMRWCAGHNCYEPIENFRPHAMNRGGLSCFCTQWWIETSYNKSPAAKAKEKGKKRGKK